MISEDGTPGHIRHEPTTSILRFYASAEPGPWEPYVAVCTVIWQNAERVWLCGMHGTISRKHLRELVDHLWAKGVRTIYAHRDPTRRLPWAREVGDHLEIDLAVTRERKE